MMVGPVTGRTQRAMPRIWRIIVAAGALIGASGPANAQAASPAAYSVTITATTNSGKVTGDTLVWYKLAHYDSAHVHGRVAGAAPGDTVTLLSKLFGASHFTATGKPITLTPPTSTYSFTVQPSLATRYKVRVSTGDKVDVTSSVRIVYVDTSGPPVRGTHKKCSRHRCIVTFRAYSLVPASVYKIEAAKHVYPYLAVGHPRLPRYLTLSTTATVSKAKKVHANEYVQRFRFVIPLHGKTNWIWQACTKDTERRDGIGLPGHHHCGDKKVTQGYLG